MGHDPAAPRRLGSARLEVTQLGPAIRTIIPGAASGAEVRGNRAALARDILTAFWAEPKHEGLLAPAAPVPT